MSKEKQDSPQAVPGLGLRQWLVLVLLLLLVVAVSYPGIFAHFSTRLPKAHMDTVSILGAINWQNHFLFREPGLVFNLGTFYPHSLSTFLGPPMFGLAPWFGLFQAFGLNIYGQYNLFIVLVFLFGALGVFALSLEVSVKEKAYAFVAAVIYIVFNTHRSLFTWLPLFTTCLVPWTLLFFFRYLRSRRRRDLLGFLLCGMVQFLISAYLGVYLLAFFLPWLVLFALLFKALPLKNFLAITVGVLVIAAFMLALFSPVIASHDQTTTPRSYSPTRLLDVTDLFSANRSFLYGQLLKLHRKVIYNWFPGILVSLLFLISGFSFNRARRWLWLAIIAAGLLGIVLLQDSQRLWATILYFTLLALFAASHLRERGHYLPVTLMALAFVGYITLFFNLLTLHLPWQAHPFTILAKMVPYFHRMCEFKRVFVILVPVMAVLAAHALRSLPRRHRWLPLLIVGLIWLENFEPGFRKWGKKLNWEDRAPIYAAIPRQSDKVILEIPFFGGTNIWSLPSFFQSIYVYSIRFHWNFLANGRDSFAPKDFVTLAKHASPPEILEAGNLDWLKQHHSVDYLIINWYLMDLRNIRLLRNALPVFAAAGEKVLDTHEVTVFRLQEKKELTVLKRTYSAYHLRHRQLQVRFHRPCSLLARVAIGTRFWQEFQVRDSAQLRFRVDPKRVGRDRELVTISFSQPAKVAEIALCK